MNAQDCLPEAVDAVAGEHGFSGVVSVDRGGEVEFARAYGLAHRAHQIPNTVDTRFAIASGAKGLTALVVVSLIEQGVLELSSTARSVLRDDLPLIDDRVTVEQLLAHRSGIGDYLDEDDDSLDINDYLLPVPMQELADTEQYLAVLAGFPAKFPPGQRFSYSNGGYVVLALIAERASGVPYHDLVRACVCEPAGMPDTEFLRSDELPDRTATGYVRGARRPDGAGTPPLRCTGIRRRPPDRAPAGAPRRRARRLRYAAGSSPGCSAPPN
jgi:CubicO group peptidase (beta-lactamase class C family)